MGFVRDLDIRKAMATIHIRKNRIAYIATLGAIDAIDTPPYTELLPMISGTKR